MNTPPATIVILAWNEWAATRACLDSLRPGLRPTDQVVVVDNGSTDATPRGLTRYPWVEVITNEDNRGFAAGCNQGAAAARNDIVVFLNNDTLPVGRWLDALLEPFEDDAVAGTGARSNFVSGPQLVEEVPYREARRSDVCRFERTWRMAHRGQWEDTERLVGFCLAVRRSAFEAAGGFDEGFGMGGYEDDDLCTRLRQAGHRLVIAHASYVHHDGHRTFDANGVDWFAVQTDNGARYRAKHGSVDAVAPASISACLIVKDEEQRLGACLASVAGIVDEVVVYDTGSTDGTVALARGAGATVIEGFWDDDFGRARNAALDACSGSWILQLDADEELDTRGDLRAELSCAGAVDALVVPIDNVDASGADAFAHSALRIFRRERAHWRGRLHEHVVPRAGEPGLRTRPAASMRIRHWGYTADAFDDGAKLARNVRVARAAVDDERSDARALVNLGRALGAAGDRSEAIERFAEALDAPIADVDRRLALRTGAQLLIDEERCDEALAWVDRLRPCAADPSVVRWLEAAARAGLGETERAIALLADLDEVCDGDGYHLPATAVLDRRARVLLAGGRPAEAVSELCRAAAHGVDRVDWPLAAVACVHADDDARNLVASVSGDELVPVLGALLPAPPEAGDRVLDALWHRFPGSAPVLAASVRVAPRLDLGRCIQWSARLRGHGLGASCPLPVVARDHRRPPVERLRAAVVVAEAFGAEEGHDLLELVTSGAPTGAFEDLLLAVDELAPAQLPVVVELLATTPPRCRALSDVLAGLGATEEASVIARMGEEVPVPEPAPAAALRGAPAHDPADGPADGPLPVPACSIVIPLYDKVEYTRRCIESLIETTDPRLYELVLVDNGSTDGTGELLAQLEGDVVVIRNQENLGFAAACNQGARAARGEHLLFLNNDTEARDGWLPALLDALDADPTVVAAGSRLLFPDGTIQHAGVLVAEDRRAEAQRLLPFHRLYRSPGSHPDAMRRGPVSILTGAALLVRRDAFFAAGGFDEAFWNGYEDVDLCLKLREQGGRLVYEPASCLYHHESVSGPERFTRTDENVTLLVERWSGRVAPDVLIDEHGTTHVDDRAHAHPIRPARTVAVAGSR